MSEKNILNISRKKDGELVVELPDCVQDMFLKVYENASYKRKIRISPNVSNIVLTPYVSTDTNIYVVLCSINSDILYTSNLFGKQERWLNTLYDFYAYFTDNFSHDSVNWSDSSKKIALIVGVSDYLKIKDLSYCDEDTVDWMNFLTSCGYECRVLGDNHVKNYLRYDGLATKENMQKAVQSLAMHTVKNKCVEKAVFVSSGHGNGDGNGNSYLCTYEGGKYTDREIAEDVRGIKCQKIVILDHCFSGGMCDELKSVDNLFFAAACSEKGFGYDVPQFNNGKLTYHFIQLLSENKNNEDIPSIFEKVMKCYEKAKKVDQPVFTCTSSNICF